VKTRDQDLIWINMISLVQKLNGNRNKSNKIIRVGDRLFCGWLKNLGIKISHLSIQLILINLTNLILNEGLYIFLMKNYLKYKMILHRMRFKPTILKKFKNQKNLK
jgi:hypothetical protein